ncbi:MAG: hypothetical protein IJD22_07845 [Clostridia bacterium]|nr:hypothetical protein [Clostridia bacterium]
MSNGFSCMICGGALIIQSSEVAVCENCGMKHSVESLRASMSTSQATTTPAPAPTPASSSTTVMVSSAIAGLVQMAKSSFESGDYSKAASYSENILLKDRTIVEPWYWKIVALLQQNHENNTLVAAGYFADACKAVSDKGRLTELLLESFRKASFYSSTTVPVVSKLLEGDCGVAEAFLFEALKLGKKTVDKRLDDCLSRVKEYRDGHPLYGQLIRDGWNRQAPEMKVRAEVLESIWNKFSEIFPIEKPVLEIIQVIGSFVENGKHYLEYKDWWLTDDKIKRVGEKAAKAMDEKKSRVAAEYWNAHPEERLALEETINRAEEKLEEVKGRLNNLDSAKKLKNLEEELLLARTAYGALGALQFKRKKELVALIENLEYEVLEAKKLLDHDLERINRKIAEIENNIQVLKNKRDFLEA